MAKKQKKQATSKSWSLLSTVSTMAAAAVAKTLLDAGWKVATGKKPPANPSDPAVSGREAITWAVVSAASLEAARHVATRKAAAYYTKSTGEAPPMRAKKKSKKA